MARLGKREGRVLVNEETLKKVVDYMERGKVYKKGMFELKRVLTEKEAFKQELKATQKRYEQGIKGKRSIKKEASKDMIVKRLAEGDKPTQADLMIMLDVAKPTIKRYLDELHEEGRLNVGQLSYKGKKAYEE